MPQGVAIGPGGLQGHDQASPPPDRAQQFGQPHHFRGIPRPPGPIEIPAAPPQRAQDRFLADIQPRMDDRFVAPLQPGRRLDAIDIHGPICSALHGDDLLYVDTVFVTEHHYSTFEASPLSTPLL